MTKNMTRDEAEDLLFAYVRLLEFDDKASDVLERIIIDAMTEPRASPVRSYGGIVANLTADGGEDRGGES